MLVKENDYRSAEPLPFEDVSPGYFEFWRRHRPKGSSFIRGGYDDDDSWRYATVQTICDSIESERRLVLRCRGIGLKRVREHIEVFYQQGLVTQAWYEQQMARYSR